MNNAVIWSWAFNALRLSAGLILLPLLLKTLTQADLGMYYVFLRLIALIPILDFGFSVSMGRSVSYAMGGAQTLEAQGIQKTVGEKEPNWALLWQLLSTFRTLYKILALAAFLFLGLVGTWNIGLTVAQTHNPSFTWMAWALTLIVATMEMYLSWWNTYLRGCDKVATAARYAVIGYSLQISIAAVLLLNGGGLLSLPLGSLVGGLVRRSLSRRACLRILRQHPVDTPTRPTRDLLRTLWPNTWRVGLHHVSHFIGINLPGLIFASQFGLDVFTPYAVSLQIISICASMATVWVEVEWPRAGQLRARQDLSGLRRLLWPRLWLQYMSFFVLTGLAISVGPLLLNWLDTGKSILSVPLLILLAANTFLMCNFSFWGTLLSTGNMVPYLRSALLTNLGGVFLFIFLATTFNLQYLALILAPLITGSLFIYWYWPLRGAQSLGTTWWCFITRRSETEHLEEPRCEKK
ncbi:MAG: O-antigen/teichoic acid export membrane protein [Candidatus Promineifilaceae bacterium]|jgi:O-antigen/teichoic acid export membrane protein